jgi:hypothetical protein
VAFPLDSLPMLASRVSVIDYGTPSPGSAIVVPSRISVAVYAPARIPRIRFVPLDVLHTTKAITLRLCS